VDVLEIDHNGTSTRFSVDPLLVEVCEPFTLRAVSAIPGFPVAVGVTKDWNKDGEFELRTERNIRTSVTVMVIGVRKGFLGRRFKEMTQADYDKGLRMWGGKHAD